MYPECAVPRSGYNTVCSKSERKTTKQTVSRNLQLDITKEECQRNIDILADSI